MTSQPVAREPPRERGAEGAGADDTAEDLFAAPVNRLITELARLPGIGQRTAQRLAFHILSVSEEEALGLADAIREVKETVGQCEICFNLATEADLPDLPGRAPRGGHDLRGRAAQRRDPDRALGRVPRPLPRARRRAVADRRRRPGGPPHRELLGRVDNGAGVTEVVIATNATTTGEATALYLADALRQRSPDLVVTRLASGLPVGSDLEYADEITLGRALRGRQAL